MTVREFKKWVNSIDVKHDDLLANFGVMLDSKDTEQGWVMEIKPVCLTFVPTAGDPFIAIEFEKC